MTYLNLHLPTTLRAPEFIGCEPVDQSTWLKLCAYCCEQENGGVVENCSDWGDRRWMATCTVSRAEVHRSCGLWNWDGDSIVVWNYPADKEAEVKAMRAGGRRGGFRSGKSRASSPPLKPPLKGGVEAPLERKGSTKEGEVQEEVLSPREETPEVAPEAAYAEAPSWEEWWAYCQQITYAAEWHARDKFLAAGQDNWTKCRNWRAYAARCRAFWEQDGRPMHPPSKKGNGESGSKAYWESKSRYDMVCSEIKAIEDRAATDAMQTKIFGEPDKTNRSRLIAQRKQLRKELGLTQ